MATIRQIVPSSAISEFRPVRQEGGNGFRLVAEAMDEAYKYMLPAAVQEATERGDALGREIAKQQIGEPAVYTPSTKGPADPNAQLGADAMAALGKGDAPSRLKAKLVARGLPDHIADGFVMNFGDESGFNPGINEIAPLVPGSRGGFGLYQLTGPRRREYEAFAAARGVPVEDEDAQLDFLMQELQGSEADAWSKISGAQTAGEAGAAIVTHFLRPSEEHRATRAAKYLGGNGVTASTSGGAPVAPTVLRDADGKLVSRLFGPTSNPIMAAHAAAAGAAYQSDVFLKSAQDFMGMSEQFALDPEGFKQAADDYVSAMVEAAPEQFRMDVRANLEKEANRRFLGIVDERQRDIRTRAANSTGALADKWSDELASAIATGNPEEIEAARSELASVLAVRERLPGLSWTPEQSFNYLRQAEAEGQRRIEEAQKEQKNAWKSSLNLIIETAKGGRVAADETILDNPSVQAAMPELWREAAAFTTLRDELPSFNMMTPAEQAAALAEMKAQPVQEQWENDLYGAAEKAAGANAKAWSEDPIKRAGEVLVDEPPPPLPEFDPNAPEAFMSALTARADYAAKMTERGYTSREFYLSKEEAKTVGAMFGKDVPPELKAMAAGAVVGAMGADAAGFFRQINTTDPVLPHVGALMAIGGDTAVAVEAMQGQAMIDQKIVQAPTFAAVSKGMAAVQDGLVGVPGAATALEGVRKTATAIYAARIAAGADEQTQSKVMEEAWQAALGQTNQLDVLRGGVQEVGGQKVLLPPSVAGADLESALKSAFGDPGGFWSWAPQIESRPDLWAAAGNGIPAAGGQRLAPSLWQNGEIILTPVGGNNYMMSVKRGDQIIDIGVEGQPDDVPFIFDAEALIAASMVPK